MAFFLLLSIFSNFFNPINHKKRAGRITAADSVHKEKHNCLQYMVYEQKKFRG